MDIVLSVHTKSHAGFYNLVPRLMTLNDLI